MKVAYIFTLFPQYSETFACLDVKEMLKLNNNISVFSLRRPKNGQKSLLKDRGLPTDILNYSTVIQCIWALFDFTKVFFLFKSIMSSELNNRNKFKCLIYLPSSISTFNKINESCIDIVHLFWGHTPSLLGLLLKKYKPNIKVTMFLGAYDLHQKLGVTKLMLSKADRVFTHSFVNVNIIRKIEPSVDPIVIYRGIDTDLPLYNFREMKVINRWGIASRLIKEKNIDKSIKLFWEFSKIHSDATLCIFGDGQEKSNLIKLCEELGIKDKVTFYGHLDQVSMLKLMATCEVSLLLSTKLGECLPNSVKEAMYLGCKVIVSKTPGIEELIPDDSFGYVVKNLEEFMLQSAYEVSKVLNEINTDLAIYIIDAKFSSYKSALKYDKEWNEISE